MSVSLVRLPPLTRVSVGGIGFDALTEQEVVAEVRAALGRGDGGRILTPNVDILRLMAGSPEVRAHAEEASLVVADGMPVVWASVIAGGRRGGLPERVAGSSLIWSLCAVCAVDGHRVFLLGGAPGSPGVPSGAQRAAAVLGLRYPRLTLAGCVSPPFGFERDGARLGAVLGDVIEAKPDLVLVGLGFPKQEQIIDLLRPELPGAWFLGCGASINFVIGDERRAPRWMQRGGLEWLHRLAQEPRRLGPRYLRDLPFALRLLGRSAVTRARTRR
jgi:N-acetylglucosaminyldiphosphoundecaprenol N-acetyl-beta-D-mannosaminyltransferase